MIVAMIIVVKDKPDPYIQKKTKMHVCLRIMYSQINLNNLDKLLGGISQTWCGSENKSILSDGI